LREIILDTETTGLDPFDGHRIVEIGCVELINCIPTGRVWHCHLNPERDVPYQAFEVHGLSTEFLSDKPRFAELADDMLAFLEGARLVMHNAIFDFGFLNAELDRSSRPLLRWDHVVDTLALARRRHPGAPCSLDALCKRYGIDLSRRDKHSALLDCRLLAAVYRARRRPSAAVSSRSMAGKRSCWGRTPEPSPPSTAAGTAADRGGTRGAPRVRGARAEALWLRYQPVVSFVGARLKLAFRRLEVLSVELGEIDRIEQQRWEAPVTDGVGENAAHERKQDRRAIDEQDRLQQVLGHAAQAEQSAIYELHIVDDAYVAAGMNLEL
jgi:DNA polymerase-3 subunit epsilon